MSDGMREARTILIEVLGEELADVIEPDAMLVDDLGADSLDLVEVQIALMDEFDIDAPDEAFSSRMRVSDLAELITKRPA